MKEIEVKILEINRKQVCKQLEDLGAELLFDGPTDSIIFEDDSMKEKGIFLRIRKNGGKNILTLKKYLGIDAGDDAGANVMEEIELEIDDYDAIKQIFLELGYPVVLEYNKKRTSYRLGKILFEIDEHNDIPPYLEIEGPSLEEIYVAAKKLGFSRDDCKDWSGSDVYRYYGKKGI